MKISEVLKISMTFIGTIIGAGFASGREIALYFGDSSPAVPVLAGILLGAFSFLFAELGRMSKKGDDILGLIFKKAAFPVRKFIEIANYVTFIAMIAGAELILRDTFFIAGGGIFSALLSFAILLKGNDGMKILNAVLVPLIVIAVVGLGMKAPDAPTPTAFSLLPPLSYASMNLLTGGYLIGKLTAERNRKENFAIGIIVAVVTALLLSLIYRIVLVEKDAAMPVGAFAAGLNLSFVSGILIYLAILTTMVSSLKVSADGKNARALTAIAVGFVLSLIGFETLVDNFYPIIGYAGIALSAAALFYYLKDIIFRVLKKTPTLHVGVKSKKIKFRKPIILFQLPKLSKKLFNHNIFRPDKNREFRF